MVYVDQKKAFDSANHEHIFHHLAMYGFPPDFQELVKAIYRAPQAQIITPHGLTLPIPITRGIRQGCPLSPWLYAMYIEPILLHLEHLPDSGYQVNPTVAMTVGGFADDIVLVARDRPAMERVWNTFLAFCTANGIEISNDSKEKTTYTHVRSTANQVLRDPAGKAIPFLRPDEHYKYLGIFISLDLTWNRQRQETERTLLRHLGFLRRTAFNGEQSVTILNRVILPGILYRAHCVPFPLDFLHQCDGKIAGFLRQKFRLPGNMARGFFFESKQNNGYGALSMEVHCPAALAHCTFATGLNSWDAITRSTSATMQYHHTRQLQAAFGLTEQLSLVRNVCGTADARASTVNHLPPHLMRTPHHIDEKAPLLSQIVDIGRLSIQKMQQLRLTVPQQRRLRTCLTIRGTDMITLRPDIQHDLNTMQQPTLNGRLPRGNTWSIFVDGSYDAATATGGGAVIIRGADPIITPMSSCDSALEAELTAIWYALFCCPLAKIAKIYTDCWQGITDIGKRLDQQRPARHVPSIRQDYLLSRITELLLRRARAGVTTAFHFIYAHLFNRNTPNRAARLEAMRQRYGDATDALLEGQAEAHFHARRALQEAQLPTTLVDPGAQKPPFALRVRGLTIQQQQVKKNLIERRAKKLLKQHRRAHPPSQAPLLSAQVDASASKVIMLDTTPANSERRRTLLRLRNGSLPTRQRHYAYQERARLEGFTSAFLRRIAPTSHSPLCPFGCNREEADDHLANCPATEYIRTQADQLILSTLRSAGYEGADFGWLAANCPVSRAWRLAGYIPAEWATSLRKCPTTSNRLVLIIQCILADALALSWQRRCARLFGRISPQELAFRPTLALLPREAPAERRQNNEELHSPLIIRAQQ
jgi:hypothetical protein